MDNKYQPKIICTKCNNIIWNNNNSTKSVICQKCKTKNNKILHGLIGGEVYKNQNNNYVLSFPQYGEINTYADFKDLNKELIELMNDTSKVKND